MGVTRQSAVRRPIVKLKSEKILVTTANFKSALSYLHKYNRWAVDTETTGLHVWGEDVLCGISISPMIAGSNAFYFPFRHGSGKNLPEKYLSSVIHPMNDPSRRLVGWNLKFDMHMLIKDGLRLPTHGRAEDVLLAAHLCNESEINYKLKDLAARYLGSGAAADEQKLADLLKSKGYGKGDMWRLSPEEVKDYAATDVILTRAMRRYYVKELEEWDLMSIWLEVNDYLLAMVRMEQRGLALDVSLTRQYLQEAREREQEILVRIKEEAGYDINPASSKQMQAFLNLPSTAKDVLESIEDPPPAVDLVLRYRQWQRVASAYYEAYLNKATGDVLHPNIKLHGTVSGRPSAEDPNLQAVPRYSDIYQVKDLFIARPGRVLVSADYSQAELRLGSWSIQEERMITILESGGDIHGDAAIEMGIDRDSAKRINFGSFYGIGARKLAKQLGIAVEEAQERLNKYHATFPNVQKHYNSLQVQAEVEGFIRMWTGRVKRYHVRNAEPRKALSNLVQGGVAEIMRVAITRIDRAINDGHLKNTFMLLQVHDQILFDIREEDFEDHIRLIKRYMEDFPQMRPSPKVDIKVGQRWSELEDWKDEE